MLLFTLVICLFMGLIFGRFSSQMDWYARLSSIMDMCRGDFGDSCGRLVCVGFLFIYFESRGSLMDGMLVLIVMFLVMVGCQVEWVGAVGCQVE